MKKFLWILLLFVLIPLAAYGETVIVSPEKGALEEALANCADGDVILLEDGVYAEPQVSFPLTVTRAVTVSAAEGAHPIIDSPAMVAAFRIEADHVTLEGLDIRFRRYGIYAIGNDMTLENCGITLADEGWRVSSCGIWCGGIYRMTLRECRFTGCGVSLAGPPLSERSENLPKLTGLFEVGEDPEYFTTHTIDRCTVNGKPLFYTVNLPEVTVPQGAGEIICCGCGEVTVRDAEITDCSMGMVLVHNKRVTVENSSADRCGVFGIYVAKCDGGEITGCSSRGTNHGIDIRADRNIVLRNCTADACEQGLFFSCVTDSMMLDCTVRDTRQGVFLAAGEGNILQNCLVTGCENGIHAEKETNALITACTVEKCTVCGVRADRTAMILDGNTLKDNWTAMIMYGNTPSDIVNNLFTGNENCGMFLRNIGKSRLIGNRMENSGMYSLIAAGKVNGSIWSRNELDVPADLSEVEDGFVRME